MDEVFLFLLAGALLISIPVSLVLALVAWSRSRRVRDLESRLSLLERDWARPSAAREGARAQPAEPTRAPARTAAPPAPVAPPLATTSVAASPTPAPRPIEPSPAGLAQAPASAPARGFDWERLLGVRGAAVVGGLVLALAGLLFVQHSIQQGWITPQLRVWLAAGCGLIALGVSQWWFKRGYAIASNALAGAGGVLIFGALWAGYRLYGMFGFAPAFCGMLLCSVVLALLALRRPSKVVAVFGVLGGFVTPLLVTLSAQSPLALFAYLLLLDVGLFALTRRRGWGLLGVLGALGSIAVFASYVGLHFDPGTAPLALAFVAGSALALCLPALIGERGSERPPLAGAAVALAGSFPLALFVVARADLGQGLMPLALTGAVLLLLAGVVARRTQFPGLPEGASLGALALVLTWSLKTRMGGSESWKFLAAAALLALVPHLLAEWDLLRKRRAQVGAASLLALGLAGIGVAAVLRAQGAQPLAVLGWALVPAAFLLRQAWLSASGGLAVCAALPGGGLGLALAISQGAGLSLPLGPTFSIALVGLTALIAVHAWLVQPVERRAGAWLGAAISALFGLAALTVRSHAQRGAPWEFHLACLGLVLIAAQAAGRRGSGLLMGAALLGGALPHFDWFHSALPGESPAWIALVGGAACVFALVLGPRARWSDSPSPAGPWLAAALAPIAWMPVWIGLCFDHLAESLHTLPVALGVVPALCLAWRARRLVGDASAALRRHALAAALGAALVLLACLPPLAFERGISAAAFTAVLLLALLWKRLPHLGLALGAGVLCVLGLLGVFIETVGLLENVWRWPRSGWPVVHWLSYGWLLPALAAAWSAVLFARASTPARRSARLAGLSALLLGFVWINLEVQNHYMQLDLTQFERVRIPARAFATSCAWALYAFGLLVAGLRSRGSALRKASLVFLLAAIAKVFLYDLGALTGLYRVGSLVGLAVALFAVSLCYQRFVFKRAAALAPEAATG